MASIIIKVADDRVDLRARQLVATAPWLGQPYVTILIREEDLLKQPNLEISMVIHTKNKPDNVLPNFLDNPREMPRGRFMRSETLDSLDGKYKSDKVVMR